MSKKSFIQDCCIFIGITLFIISLSFWLIVDPDWCQDMALVLTLSGTNLAVISFLHKAIFGDY